MPNQVFKSSLLPVNVPKGADIYSFVLRDTVDRTRITLPAFIDAASGKSITYASFIHETERLAAGLIERCGLHKGDVIAIYSPNHLHFPIALYAALRIAATVTTINPQYTMEELAYQLKDSQARILFTIPECLQSAKMAASIAHIPEDRIFLFGGVRVGTFLTVPDIVGEKPLPKIEFTEEDLNRPALLCYSSGTTGRSKGVELLHRNIIANVLQVFSAEHSEFGVGDKAIGVLPFFHVYGLVILLFMSIYAGQTTVIVEKFELETFLQYTEKYKVKFSYIVPPIAIALAKSPIVDRYDLSSVRYYMSGAAPLGADVAKEVAGRLKAHVKQGYGMSELSPVATINPGINIVHGSVGVLVGSTEAKVIDVETGKPLGVNQVGELWIRGPNVMKGYLNNPSATKETIDADGFLHTGDMVYVDEKGYFFVVDRIKELIKYKGFQVAPAELEALLLTHPQVADVAVIPKPDAVAGEVPIAFVVLKPGFKSTPEAAKELISYVDAKVSQHKRLRGGVEFIAQIPKSASGKILRRILKDQLNDASDKAKL